MYAVNIRGPVVLYVHSYKDRHFGGYSTMMFPKYDEDNLLEFRTVDAFLFSLDHKERLPLKEEYRRYALKGGLNFGFGQGDLLISD
jgi:predicted N-acyltransferase